MHISLSRVTKLALIMGLLLVLAPLSGQCTERSSTVERPSRIDRSTPESLVATFQSVADEIYAFVEGLEKRRITQRLWLYPQPSAAERRRVHRLLKSAADSLDLSQTPEWSRHTTTIEAVLMMREILRLSGSPQTEVRPVRDALWIVPRAYLQITRQSSGMRAGDHVFTAETIANLPAIYEDLIEQRPAADFDAYRHFTETPGGLIPPPWAGLAFKLPSIFLFSIGSNTLWQWMLFVATTVGVGWIAWSSRRLARQRIVAVFYVFAATALLALIANHIVIEVGSLTGPGGRVASGLYSVSTFAALAVCVFLSFELAAQLIANLIQKHHTTPNITMIHLSCRVLGVAAAGSLLILAISTAGVPVVGIVAGLGVGGLAVALATKTTLENLLAGVVLNLDGTVAAGDVIETKDFAGKVLAIGMRSTRLRAEDGSLISITNAQLADKIIKNSSRTQTPSA